MYGDMAAIRSDYSLFVYNNLQILMTAVNPMSISGKIILVNLLS